MARLIPLLLGASLLAPGVPEMVFKRECHEVEGDFYQFSAKTLNGSTVSFDEYRGKVVLAYNVATY